MQQPISSKYVFPRYATRDDYERATGQPCPFFDQTRKPKYWFDPTAMANTRRSLVYDIVAVTDGGTLILEDGKPIIDILALTKEEAATVNIPVSNTTYMGGVYGEVPCPIKPLEADEELAYVLPGVAVVRKKGVVDPGTDGWTVEDRALLRRIAEKLGVA